jgi:hypothetical protein
MMIETNLQSRPIPREKTQKSVGFFRMYMIGNFIRNLFTYFAMTRLVKSRLCMIFRCTLLIGFLHVFITGCKDLDSPVIHSANIFLDYKISSEELNGEVTVLLQFRYGGPYGSSIRLKPPAGVEIDGQVIPADSSKMTGAFYEVRSPIREFTGKHSIKFIDMEGNEFTEEFVFRPFDLSTKVPATVSRSEDLRLELQGLDTVSYFRVLLTDTAFDNMGINRMDTVRNGSITISRAELATLTPGPIHLELILEDEKHLEGPNSPVGRLSISYGLSREFNLAD